MDQFRPTRRRLLSIGAGVVALSGCAGEEGNDGDGAPETPLPDPIEDRGYYDRLLPPVRPSEFPDPVLRFWAFERTAMERYVHLLDPYLVLFIAEVLTPLQMKEPPDEFDRLVFATPPDTGYFAYALLEGVPIPTDLVPTFLEGGRWTDSVRVHDEGSHGGFEVYSTSRQSISWLAISEERIFVVPELPNFELASHEFLVRVIDTWNGDTGSLLRENEPARRLCETLSTPGATVGAVRLANGTDGDDQYIPPGATAGGVGFSLQAPPEKRRLNYAGVYPDEPHESSSFERFLHDNWNADRTLGLEEPTIQRDGSVLLATGDRPLDER